ncbi:AAA family ATPase [Paracoccus aminophilus]|nr:AAA family ATPase [Paracoccus aminophilus]
MSGQEKVFFEEEVSGYPVPRVASLKVYGQVGRVQNLTLHFEPDITVIAGQNGVGKTTILRILADKLTEYGSAEFRRQKLQSLSIGIRPGTKSRGVKTVLLFGRREGGENGPEMDETTFSSDGFVAWWNERDIAHARAVRDSGDLTVKDPQLQVFQEALARVEAFKGVKVYSAGNTMAFERSGVKMKWHELSSGERSVFSLFGMIARRVALSSEEYSRPLVLVLIDEIDLHLHPKWQRTIVPLLREAFPDVQFVVTTHSPQVVGSVEGRCVRLLALSDNGDIKVSVPKATMGVDSNFILEALMDADERAPEAAAQIDEVIELIKQKRFADAQFRVDALKDIIEGDAPIISRMQLQLDMARKRSAS